MENGTKSCTKSSTKRLSSLRLRKISKNEPDEKSCSKENCEEEYKTLKAEEELLDKEIADLENQGIDTNLKPQMEALHEYNDVKDATQRVLGYIADLEQTTVTEVHNRFSLPTTD